MIGGDGCRPQRIRGTAEVAAGSVLLEQRPTGGAGRYKTETFELNARVVIQAVGGGIHKTQLHLVPARLTVSVDEHRDKNRRAIGGKIPTLAFVDRRCVLGLNNLDAAAAADSNTCAGDKAVGPAVQRAVIVGIEVIGIII